MKKFWIVWGEVNNASFKKFDSYQEAEDAAKRLTAINHGNEFVVLEAVASTKQPVPDIEIVKL